MRILVPGGHGFIGARLAAALVTRGHEVIVPHGAAHRFTFLSTPEDWKPVLQDIDAVVNVVGVFREQGDATFDAVHRHGPAMLALACVESGVPRLVHLSALGADDEGTTAYHRSKKAGDDVLLSFGGLDVSVVQPSLVFGPEGTSAQAFLALASCPLLPLPAGGAQRIQPIHVDDLVEALVALVEAPAGGHSGRRIALVGPRPTTLADYLQDLRQAMQMPPARVLPVPRWMVDVAAGIGDHVRGSLLDRASWSMLERGNVADPSATRRLLERSPATPPQFVPPSWADAARVRSQWTWQRWLLRISLAIVWIGTAIVSFGVYPVEDSLQLLARTGVPAALRWPMLYAAAALDLLFGVLTLWPWRPSTARALWVAQAALIVVYTVIITMRMPEFWLHPYGPLLKNVPMLAVLWVLAASERRDVKRAGAGR